MANFHERNFRIAGPRSLAAFVVLSAVTWAGLAGSASDPAHQSPSIVSLSSSATSAAKPVKGQYPPEMVVKGQVNFAGEFLDTVIFQSADGQHSVHIWESGPGVLQTDGYPHDEYCLVLEGTLEITNRSGSRATYRAGDTFVIPKGWQGVWDMKTRFRKQYVVLAAQPSNATN